MLIELSGLRTHRRDRLGRTHLIMDRDPVFTARVRDMLRHAGTKPVRLPRRSPNLNAFIERFIRSIKEECLDRVIPLGEAYLREVIREYMAHYHAERPHQGLDGTLIQPAKDRAAPEMPSRQAPRTKGNLITPNAQPCRAAH